MINTLLTGVAFDMMKMLRKIRETDIRVLNEFIENLAWKSQILIKFC